MVRQIILRLGATAPKNSTGNDPVGLLLTSADLSDNEVAILGERLLRAGQSTKGRYHDVNYRFEILDHLVPGLELQTVELPVKVTYRDIERLEALMIADGDRCVSRGEEVIDNLVRESLGFGGRYAPVAEVRDGGRVLFFGHDPATAPRIDVNPAAREMLSAARLRAPRQRRRGHRVELFAAAVILMAIVLVVAAGAR